MRDHDDGIVLQTWGEALYWNFEHAWEEAARVLDVYPVLKRVEVDPVLDEGCRDIGTGGKIAWTVRIADEIIREFCRGLDVPIQVVHVNARSNSE